MIPSLEQVAWLMARTKTRRGHGDDAIPGEVYRYFAPQLAEIFYPIWLKAICRVEEPIEWKGGCLSELWKGKGAPEVCKNSRGISVAD
eukprot:11778957-Alexandrium_andersonii.AAC.1